jgi:lipopolysaccharide heptosyltransferase I
MKILFVRLGALGDIIHTVPAVSAVRGALPQASIHWLVDVRHLDLLELVEGVDRIHPVRSSPAGWLSAIAALRRERFDAALDFQGLIKSASLARLSGARLVAGFKGGGVREPAAVSFYSATVAAAPGHVIEKNLSLLRAINIHQPAAPCFAFARRPSSALQRVRTQAGERFAIINPGAAWPNKRWHPERFGAVAEAIRVRHAMRSVVIWGPGERELADRVIAASDGAALAAPATSIADLFAMSAAAALMVSGDTGPLHIAAASGTPIVGLYGPTDPRRNGPWSREDLSVSRFEACGCHHLRRCVRDRWCLEDVQVEEVVDAIDRRLAPAGAR